MSTKSRLAIAVGIIVLIALSICFKLSEFGKKDTEVENKIIDLKSATVEQIAERAKEEGKFESLCLLGKMHGMDDILNNFSSRYGIGYEDYYMDNKDIIEKFSKDKSKAIGIVDLSVAEKAAEFGILQTYENSYWDFIPDWAKDKNGLWVSAFGGCTSFLYNGGAAPCSWKDIEEGNYKITIGNAALNKTAQSVVIASSYAFGGSMDNLEPAFDFWLKMAEENRIDGGDILIPRVNSGEIELGITWSYESVFYKNSSENNNVCVAIPSDGAILMNNAFVMNKNTDTPFSAALFSEFLFSDEGQTILAKSGAIPTRTNFTIPKEIEKETFSADEYKNAVIISDYEKYLTACNKVSKWWEENIIPKIT